MFCKNLHTLHDSVHEKFAYGNHHCVRVSLCNDWKYESLFRVWDNQVDMQSSISACFGFLYWLKVHISISPNILLKLCYLCHNNPPHPSPSPPHQWERASKSAWGKVVKLGHRGRSWESSISQTLGSEKNRRKHERVECVLSFLFRVYFP